MTKKDLKLNKRQDFILDYVGEHSGASIGDILTTLSKEIAGVTKITVNRDLKKLIDLKFLVSHGIGKATTYSISGSYSALKHVDVDDYFSEEADERKVNSRFNFDVFSNLGEIFTEDEIQNLDHLNRSYLDRVKKLPKDILKKEFERLTIELSWKSSKIEGNTYSLLETEQLLRDRMEAEGHPKEDAIMILNHKNALDYMRSDTSFFKKISVKKIEELHSILVDKLGVSKNIRKSLVGITGTRYKPLDNHYQIREAMEKMCRLVNKSKNVFEKALLAMLLIAYIQPFVDGNKRTSRMIGNAILLANNACPLSYRSINEIEYKKAVLLFYEQNNLSYFKKLFIEQYEFVVETYF